MFVLQYISLTNNTLLANFPIEFVKIKIKIKINIKNYGSMFVFPLLIRDCSYSLPGFIQRKKINFIVNGSRLKKIKKPEIRKTVIKTMFALKCCVFCLQIMF